MKVAILTIGSELLEGSVVDTNSAFIANHLTHIGATPELIRMVPDNRDIIIEAFRTYSKEFDLILITGGLGPTFDDITAESLAEAAGIKTSLNNKAYQHISSRLNKLGVAIGETHLHQAYLPEGATLFDNNHGTALGFSIKFNKATFIAMPGVPYEMKPMFLDYIIPFIKEHFGFEEHIYKDLLFANIPESDIDNALRELNISSNTQVIINASIGRVTIKLRGRDSFEIESISNALKGKFALNFIAENISNNIALELFRILKENKKTVSFAESCTAGLLSSTFAEISGVSEIFPGSIVSYDNRIKSALLGVSEETLKEYGAVSKETAIEMAEGVRNALGTDFAVSITGIAGPTGGSEDKPVGTVYFGFSANGSKAYHHKLFPRNDRQVIRSRAVNEAIFQGIRFIKENI